MRRLLLTGSFILFVAILSAQEPVKGTRKQLIQEILTLRKENSELKLMIDQNSIGLYDTVSTTDTLNWSGVFDYFESEEEPFVGSTDSLLSAFYLQRSLHLNIEDDFLDLDNISFVADLPDSVYIQRLKALNSFINLPYNDIVKNRIVYYTQKMPKQIATILGLSAYYMPIFEEIFDYHDMPLELKALAIIESALNPTAVSRAKARGMWQFMHRTALEYKLQITSFVDERYDPILSGHAAARYLKDAYAVFGDWALAISSYNCGFGNVDKAIRRAGSRAFWDIYPYLPKETRGYVPAFVAALYTLTYYKEHGIRPLPIEMPAHIDTFHVTQRVHFSQIAEITGISVDELRDLNPQYIRDIIPGKPFILRLPYPYTSLFAEKEQEIYTYNENAYFNSILLGQSNPQPSTSRAQTTHTVKAGETLGGIAQKYRVKTSDLQYWNNIKGTLIRPGQKLAIFSGQAVASTPTTTTKPSTTSSTTSPATSSAAKSSTTSSQSATYQWHTIQKGDTLWEIAKKYSISLNDLLSLNGLNANSKIIAGKKLKIKAL
ncbi:MAG: LysM peptidoglycan-binding domain-containing protein [Prevotellaceae bacterium]|jgi:membrane-bound lytic murein transglycosylase D|nr:LysM peptidoglycan-binding domain-containing protein [Prevotellaceae bacterium]